MALEKQQISFKIKVDKEVLFAYHDTSKKIDEYHKDNPIQIFDKTFHSLNDDKSELQNIVLTFYCEPESLQKKLTEFLAFAQDGKRVLDDESKSNLLGIVNAYVDNEYALVYSGGHVQDDIASTDETNDWMLKEARELLKNLRNLLYIRDNYKGNVKVKFECMEIENGKETYKDRENSVQLDDGRNGGLLDLAIKNAFLEIQIATYNNYLQGVVYDITEPLQPTYEIANKAHERYRKKDNKKKPINPMNVFRGQLSVVIGRYLDKYSSIKLEPTTKNEYIFDILSAFGLVDDEKITSKTDRKQKFDYVKGLPTEGFAEIDITSHNTREE